MVKKAKKPSKPKVVEVTVKTTQNPAKVARDIVEKYFTGRGDPRVVAKIAGEGTVVIIDKNNYTIRRGLSVLYNGRAPLVAGNSKLASNILTFSTLPGARGTCAYTCQGCYAMKELRYPAVKEKRRQLTVCADIAPRALGFMIGFQLAKYLKLRKKKGQVYVRVHESGDFMTANPAAYIKMWRDIAKAFPKVKFYAYTKVGPLGVKYAKQMAKYKVTGAPKLYFGAPDIRAMQTVASLIKRYLKSLPNFVVKESFVEVDGVVYPNFGPKELMEDIVRRLKKKRKKAVICPDTLRKHRGESYNQSCGSKCTFCMNKRMENVPILFIQH